MSIGHEAGSGLVKKVSHVQHNVDQELASPYCGRSAYVSHLLLNVANKLCCPRSERDSLQYEL